MHLLFTQVHLLIDSSVEGQYITVENKIVYKEGTYWSIIKQSKTEKLQISKKYLLKYI